MKYNLRNIMRNAWNLRKTYEVSMSVAMKAAWALEKATIAAEKAGKESKWNYRVVVNDWVKYGKNRTYVNVRIYTNAWHCKRELSMGYVDNTTGEYVVAA